jgi:uncharacterized protein (TIGR02246 family)
MTGNTITAGSDTDRQAIRDVLASLYKAWEAGDADAFVADYADDATVVQPGVYKKDREEIRSTMAAAFAGPLSGSRATDHPSAIRFLTNDTAIVISDRADNLRRLGRPGEAAGELHTAVTLAPTKAEQRLLQDRLNGVRSDLR